MTVRLVHSHTPAEDAVVLFDGNTPVLLRLENGGDLPVGAVCLARVLKRVSNILFVEIDGKTAFLPDDGAYCGISCERAEKRPDQGDLLLVQVVRAASEDKDVKVSGRLAMPFSYFVDTPADTGVSVSRKIPDAERARLKKLFENEKGAFTVRTAAQGVPDDVLKSELAAMKAARSALADQAANGKTGVLKKTAPLVEALLEEYAPVVTEAVSDDPQTAARLKNSFPVLRYSPRCLWEEGGIADAFDRATARRVPLPSGGSLIVEETAACVCFDVNAGGSGFVETNREAAAEIPKQVVLKDLSGQMIVDFAGRKDRKFLASLAEGLKNSNAGLNVWGVTALGLVEMTRKGGKASILEQSAKMAWRETAGLVRRLWFSKPHGDLCVYVPDGVGALFSPFLPLLKERLGVRISVKRGENIFTEGTD